MNVHNFMNEFKKVLVDDLLWWWLSIGQMTLLFPLADCSYGHPSAYAAEPIDVRASNLHALFTLLFCKFNGLLLNDVLNIFFGHHLNYSARNLQSRWYISSQLDNPITLTIVIKFYSSDVQMKLQFKQTLFNLLTHSPGLESQRSIAFWKTCRVLRSNKICLDWSFIRMSDERNSTTILI